MPKTNGSATGARWVAGALATVFSIGLLSQLFWPNQHGKTSPQFEFRRTENYLANDRSEQITAGIDPAPFQASAVQAEEDGSRGNRISHGHLPPNSIDPEKVYQALMGFDTTEVDRAISTVSQHAEALYGFNAVFRRIGELCEDANPQVAERAQHARHRLMTLRTAHEIPEPPRPDSDQPWQTKESMAGPLDFLEAMVEPFESLQERALYDPDPAVRFGGIETAMSQEDNYSLGLLADVIRIDYHPDNRLAAVSELEQMLKSGLGDSQQILKLLQETATDSDPRVAELSELIIQEQFITR